MEGKPQKLQKRTPANPNHEEAMRELQDLISAIRPDPKYARSCHIPQCNGKKGWYGISCYTTEDGQKHYQIEVCCGMVGEPEYTRIMNALNAGFQRIDGSLAQLLTSSTEMRLATREAIRQSNLTHRSATESLVAWEQTWWEKLGRLIDRLRRPRHRAMPISEQKDETPKPVTAGESMRD